VDLAFTKSVTRGERKLNFDQFRAAIGILGAKRFSDLSAADAQTKIEEMVVAATPESKSTKVANDAILQKMTDASQYTGAHKERFDKDGHGRGAAGRDMGGKSDLSAILDRDPNTDVRGVKK
jgi:hypothetical protein